MYCGTCLHTALFVRALCDRGADAVLAPVYMPLLVGEDQVPSLPVLFGSLNVFLQQYVPLFRWTPSWVDRWFDRPALLRWLARYSGTTSPRGLGPLTVSVLRGEHGNQRKELAKLADFLGEHFRPDIIHLSNALLMGMAGELRRRLQVPVVCTLSGEDIFVEGLREPYRSETKRLVAEQTQHVAALAATSRYYGDFAREYFGLSAEKIRVIPPAINPPVAEPEAGLSGTALGETAGGAADTLSAAKERDAEPTATVARSSAEPMRKVIQTSGEQKEQTVDLRHSTPRREFAGESLSQGGASGSHSIRIGFLGRICPQKGLHLLLEAIGLLFHENGWRNLRLVAAGQVLGENRDYLQQLQLTAQTQGLAGCFEYIGAVSQEEKSGLLRSFDLMCLPSIHPEAKGLVAIEALAHGVPVLLPRHGAYCEIAERIGWPHLYWPNEPSTIAAGLQALLKHLETARKLANDSRQIVAKYYSAERMADEILALYQEILPVGQSRLYTSK